ncbi:g659 [Coccomyxa elongata]
MERKRERVVRFAEDVKKDDGVLYTLSDCPVWLPSSFEPPADVVDFMRICPRARLEHCDSHYVWWELWYLIKPSRRTCREIVRESRLEGDPSTLMATSTLLITCSMGRDFQMSLTARLNLMTFVRNMASYAQCELNMFLLERDAPIIEKTYMFVDGGREESQWLLM